MATREERYARQLVLKEIGPAGQQLLFGASALVAGCGALGSSQSQLLVRAGVGRIRLVDRDVPAVSNLHRQLLYDEDDVATARPKAEVAAEKLRRVNSACVIEPVVTSIDRSNVEHLIRDVDVVLDATDNFATRYVLNDACVKHGKPWIYGGIIGVTGMSLTILPGKSACLRCLFPEPPAPSTVLTPETEGILNTAPATVGAHQATEAYKLMLRRGEPCTDLVLFDLWNVCTRRVPVVRDPSCLCCALHRFEFLGEGLD